MLRYPDPSLTEEEKKKKLQSTPLLGKLEEAARDHPYSLGAVCFSFFSFPSLELSRDMDDAGDLSVPGLRHFLYKSRQHVQITSPAWEGAYEEEDNRRRYVTRLLLFLCELLGAAG
jgi:hypothetical protein